APRFSCVRAVEPPSPLLLAVAEGPRRDDGRPTEAAGDAIDRPGQLLAAYGGRIQQRELPPGLGAKRRDRDADEAHGLHQLLARQQRRRAAVDLEAILRRIPGVAARQRAEVGPA